MSPYASNPEKVENTLPQLKSILPKNVTEKKLKKYFIEL